MTDTELMRRLDVARRHLEQAQHALDEIMVSMADHPPTHQPQAPMQPSRIVDDSAQYVAWRNEFLAEWNRFCARHRVSDRVRNLGLRIFTWRPLLIQLADNGVIADAYTVPEFLNMACAQRAAGVHWLPRYFRGVGDMTEFQILGAAMRELGGAICMDAVGGPDKIADEGIDALTAAWVHADDDVITVDRIFGPDGVTIVNTDGEVIDRWPK